MIAQMLITYGGGPQSYSYETDSFKNVNFESYFDFADVLLPDIPGGIGFSTENNQEVSIEDSLKNVLDFFLKLAKRNKKLDLKNRDIIFYGISYGAGIFSYVARHLKKEGFKIKAIFFDSPWIDPEATAKNFKKIMVEHKVCDEEKLKLWSKKADECSNAILAAPGKKFTCKDGKNCDDLFNSLGPYTDSSGNFVANGYDLDPNPKTNYWYLFYYLIFFFRIFYPFFLRN